MSSNESHVFTIESESFWTALEEVAKRIKDTHLSNWEDGNGPYAVMVVKMSKDGVAMVEAASSPFAYGTIAVQAASRYLAHMAAKACVDGGGVNQTHREQLALLMATIVTNAIAMIGQLYRRRDNATEAVEKLAEACSPVFREEFLLRANQIVHSKAEASDDEGGQE
ncbi:MAG: hypothetical protein D6746_14775 [Bacteroidetes bacterium]|nr:MAG: hypothetical protein D6746_14775 [Bacteroidota bacterium]